MEPLLKTYRRFWEIREQLSFDRSACFVGGVVLMILVWVFAGVRQNALSTLEHELTHVVFAWLTFHRVKGLEVNDDGSGRMVYVGKGNWLIALAPYFFPLAATGMLFFSVAYEYATKMPLPEWVLIGSGAAVGYNLCSFWQQLHPEQTDFAAAGWVTTFCFLPAANLFMFGMILSYATGGGRGFFGFFKILSYYAKHLLD